MSNLFKKLKNGKQDSGGWQPQPPLPNPPSNLFRTSLVWWNRTLSYSNRILHGTCFVDEIIDITCLHDITFRIHTSLRHAQQQNHASNETLSYSQNSTKMHAIAFHNCCCCRVQQNPNFIRDFLKKFRSCGSLFSRLSGGVLAALAAKLERRARLQSAHALPTKVDNPARTRSRRLRWNQPANQIATLTNAVTYPQGTSRRTSPTILTQINASDMVGIIRAETLNQLICCNMLHALHTHGRRIIEMGPVVRSSGSYAGYGR